MTGDCGVCLHRLAASKEGKLCMACYKYLSLPRSAA